MADVQIAIIDQQNTQITLAAPSETQVTAAVPGVQGPAGEGVPQDGATNQVLVKQSGTDYDTVWTSNIDVPGTLDVTSTATFDSIAQHPLGSAAAPTITFTGDTNTGIYSPGAGQLALSTNGTGRLFVDASGNVGLGGASGGNRLFVDGIASNSPALFSSNTTETFIALESSSSTNNFSSRIGTTSDALTFRTLNAERLRITSAGLVGIGTSAPSEILDAYGNIRFGSPNIGRIYSTDGQRGSIQISAPNDVTNRSVSYGNNYYINSSGTWVQAQSIIGGSAIEMRANSNNYGEFLFRQKQDGDLGGAERIPLVINTNGNVGIGTTSPTYQLSVESTAPYLHLLQTGTNTGSSRVVFGDGDTPTRGQLIYDHTNDSLQSFVNGQERARIDSSGRLLVGTSSALTTFFGTAVDRLAISGGAAPQVIGCYAANQFGPRLDFVKSRSATVNGQTVVSANDGLGELYFGGSDGTSPIPAARIHCAVDGTPGTNDMPGRLVFSTTADGASSPTERMRITNAGHMYVGQTTTTDPATANTAGIAIRNDGIASLSASTSYSLILNRITNDGNIAAFSRAGTTVGTISVTTTATAYNTSSDYRLKENVTPVTDGITRLQQLKPSRFNFIADPGKTVDGFIAHEVQTIVPEAITGEKDAVDEEGNPQYQGIDQSKLVPLLTAALQEAIGEIESLKARVAALESA